MRFTRFTLWQYSWNNRRAIASHAGLVDYMRRCAARPEAAYWLQNSVQAGVYPEGPDGGWRYKFEHLPVHDELLQAYKLDEIAGQGDTFNRALRLMDWFCAHTQYCGMEIRAAFRFQGKTEDSLRILRYAYDGGFRRAINCRHKAFVFADLCTACGMFAIPVALGSFTWREGEADVDMPPCHFVVHVWLAEERRWVMFDPSLNSYVTDGTNRALNLIEIHGHHIQGEHVAIAQYDFNGTQDCRETYLDNFILNGLLELIVRSGTNRSGGPLACLLPADVPPRDGKLRTITTAEFLAEPSMKEIA